jgi:hypothetical protein
MEAECSFLVVQHVVHVLTNGLKWLNPSCDQHKQGGGGGGGVKTY